MNCLYAFILNLQNSLNILNYFRQNAIFSVFCLFIFMWLKKHIDAFRKERAFLELFINKGEIKLCFSLCILRYKVMLSNNELSFCLIEFEWREYLEYLVYKILRGGNFSMHSHEMAFLILFTKFTFFVWTLGL